MVEQQKQIEASPVVQQALGKLNVRMADLMEQINTVIKVLIDQNIELQTKLDQTSPQQPTNKRNQENLKSVYHTFFLCITNVNRKRHNMATLNKKFGIILCLIVLSVLLLVDPCIAPVTVPNNPKNGPEIASVAISNDPVWSPPLIITDPFTGKPMQPKEPL
ncbi:MAG: hypothetical protein LBH62_08165 [Nitrososphaerota archaeon]|jgi:hypothetical protein|nr:hypothetical protein [Nitrososphaerota archaeon]